MAHYGRKGSAGLLCESREIDLVVKMKRCPTCQKTYTDESLNFCLDGGTPLLVEPGTHSSRDSGATLIMSDRTESVSSPPPTEISVPRGAPTEVMPPASGTANGQQRFTAPGAYLPAQTTKPRSHLLTAGVTAIAILLLVLVGIGIALLMRGSGTSQPSNDNNIANGNASPASKTEDTKSNGNSSRPSSETGPASSGPLNITASASSTRAPLKAFSYAPENALDNSLQTAWIEGVPGPGKGEWIRCDFDREVKLNRIVMTPGYFKTAALWKQNNRLASATIFFSDGTSRNFTFPDLMQMQTLDVGGIRTRYIRLVIDDFYPGSVDSEDTPISEMSFKWEP